MAREWNSLKRTKVIGYILVFTEGQVYEGNSQTNHEQMDNIVKQMD